MKNLNTYPKHGVLIPKVGDKKTLEYIVGAFLLIVLFLGGIMFLNSSNIGKNSPAIVPPSENNLPAIGTVDNPEPEDNEEGTIPAVTEDSDQPEYPEDPVFIPASECPDGMAFNEKDGGCEPIGEATDYATVKGYGEYVSTLHEYEEQNNNKNAYREWDDTFGFVDGHPLYLRVNSIEKGKKLDFSIGYVDDAKKWHEVKRFTSEKERIKPQDKGYYSYGGCFSYPDDPLYPDKACSYYLENSMKNSYGSTHPGENYGFTVVENTSHGFGITGTLFYYQGTLSSKNKEDIQSFRSRISYDPGPSILSLSN